MKSIAIFLAVLTLALIPDLALAEKRADTKAAVSPADSKTYVIGESDLLAITVWHEPDLTRVLPVRNDGKIALPLIGELEASGHTAEQLRVEITARLKQYLEAPEVSVIVQEPRSQFFTIMGKVQKPGSYPLGQKLTVIDALAMGGGFKDFAKVGKIQIIRTHTDGRVEKMPFDYKRAANGDMKQNFELQARDLILVP